MNKPVHNVDNLLKHRRDIYLEWGEPWPGVDADMDMIDVHARIRMTVHDCINFQRSQNPHYFKCSDRELLQSFVAIHWASIVCAEEQTERTDA